jgi:hypothetical protein
MWKELGEHLEILVAMVEVTEEAEAEDASMTEVIAVAVAIAEDHLEAPLISKGMDPQHGPSIDWLLRIFQAVSLGRI